MGQQPYDYSQVHDAIEGDTEPNPEIARLRADSVVLAGKVNELEDLLMRSLTDEHGVVDGLRFIGRKFEDRTTAAELPQD